jgi:hypothetical protein
MGCHAMRKMASADVLQDHAARLREALTAG